MIIKTGIVIAMFGWSIAAVAADAVVKAKVAQDKIMKFDDQSRDLLSELYTIQKHETEVTKSRAKLNTLMLTSDGDAQALGQSVAMLEKQLQEQRQHLGQRLSLMYRWNSPSLLPFLFTSSSAMEFDRNYWIIRRLANNDIQALMNYQKTLAEAHQQRNKLRSKVRVLLSIKKQIEEQEAKLNGIFQEKTRLLQALNSEKEQGLRSLASLRKLHPELESQLRVGFFEKRGQLSPPVDGRLESSYGTKVDHTYWYRLLKKGWQYKPKRDMVHSVFGGLVAFAGLLPGYGPTVVIDHGDHYFTVYGWLSKLSTSTGSKVDEGSLIGKSGPELYFEIRHFSDAIDPAAWIKDPKNRGAQGIALSEGGHQ